MARLGKFLQTPTERKRYMIDYSQWLDSGEIVASVVYSPDTVTTPPLLVSGNVIDPGSLGLTFYVSGGADGSTYKLLVTITTDRGQVKEDFVNFTVAAP